MPFIFLFCHDLCYSNEFDISVDHVTNKDLSLPSLRSCSTIMNSNITMADVHGLRFILQIRERKTSGVLLSL